MALIFDKKDYEQGQYAKRLQAQRNSLAQARLACDEDVEQLATNAGVTPADTYRAFDDTTKIEPKPDGHLAILTRAMQVARPVNIGKQVFEYRQSSRAGNAQSSMGGRKDIVIDHTEYGYEGTVVPVHDEAFGRPWREQEANASEMFDALVDDSREAERTLMEHIDNYMWDGSAKLTVKGRKWSGLRADASVAVTTLNVDLTNPATTADEAFDEIKAKRDILRIDNDCTGSLVLGISREISSQWEELVNTGNGSNITVLEYIGKLRGIAEIVEDAALSGNQIALIFIDQQGFHPVVGMDISTYPVPRQKFNDDYTFMKWAAVGFVAKQSKSGKKCALYAAD